MWRKNMMFKFHVKLLEDLHQKKVVVSEMFQLINCWQRSQFWKFTGPFNDTWDVWESYLFVGPNPFSRTFLISLRSYQPTKGTLFLFSQQTSSFTKKKSHTTKPQIFFHRDFPLPQVKPTVQESHGHLEPLDFDLKGNKSRGVRGVRGSSAP